MRNNRIYKTHKDGFTLIELIIVLMIITLSLGLVGVLIHRSSGSLDIKRLTKDISTTLRYARNHAIAEKTMYSFIISKDKDAYGLYVDFPFDVDEDIEEAEPLIYKAIPKTTEIMFNDRPDYLRIDFFPRGNSNGGALKVVNQKGKVFYILVNRLTGRVEVKEDQNID